MWVPCYVSSALAKTSAACWSFVKRFEKAIAPPTREVPDLRKRRGHGDVIHLAVWASYLLRIEVSVRQQPCVAAEGDLYLEDLTWMERRQLVLREVAEL